MLLSHPKQDNYFEAQIQGIGAYGNLLYTYEFQFHLIR